MNQIMIISPYRHSGMWVFDDEITGLVFVGGADKIIDVATANIANAEEGFNLVFSSEPFPGADMELNWLREECGGNVYGFGDMEGWLCPALLNYFPKAPKKIFASFKGI